MFSRFQYGNAKLHTFVSTYGGRLTDMVFMLLIA
jgi:hypothetical protein